MSKYKKVNILKTVTYPTTSGVAGKKHIAVLMGGMSAEREVSLSSGKGVVATLIELGYTVTAMDVGRDLASALEQVKPDIAFNSLHGTYGEDGCIQGLLEVMNIPYTHSGVLASAIAMDKLKSRALFIANKIKCPEAILLSKTDGIVIDPMERPYVVKPIREGSSIGIEIVFEGDDYNFGDYKWEYGEQILIEKYIPGHELHVAIVNNQAIGVVEIVTKGRFYDYASKYTAGLATHLMPAPLTNIEKAKILAMASLAHNIIGCRGVSRVDFRYDPTLGVEDGFYILEVNANPGMTPLSLVPEIAAYYNISFAKLLEILIQEAKCDEWP